MNKIYENIRERRIALSMSQDELAALTGYTGRSAISKIEKGRVNLPYEKIIAFSNALRVPPEELMGYEEPKCVGEFLADLSKDNILIEYTRKIYEMPPAMRKSIYDYIDFVSRDTKP